MKIFKRLKPFSFPACALVLIMWFSINAHEFAPMVKRGPFINSPMSEFYFGDHYGYPWSWNFYGDGSWSQGMIWSGLIADYIFALTTSVLVGLLMGKFGTLAYVVKGWLGLKRLAKAVATACAAPFKLPEV